LGDSREAGAAPAGGRLTLRTRVFYGFGSVAFGVKDNGFAVFLLLFYNQVVGLPSAAVGLAIMIAVLADAAVDLVIGQASDNWRSRLGRRHPFMYAAALPVALSYLLLWHPPTGWSDTALLVYLTATAFLTRAFISMYEIPSGALAAELTSDYDERTTLASYRYLFGWLGGLSMSWLALAVFMRPTEGAASGQLSASAYSNYGWAAAAALLLGILVSAAGTHDRIPYLRRAPARRASGGQLLREMLEAVSHRSFLVLLVASLAMALAVGLGFSMLMYFHTYFWELESGQMAAFVFASLPAAVLAFVAAPRVQQHYGKRDAATVLMAAAAAVAALPIVLRLAGVLPPNGSPAILPMLLVATAISTACSITAQILVYSMMADVVEDAELRTGRRQEGVYASASTFVNKSVSGFGAFLSSVLLVIVGFPEAARPGELAPDVIERLGAGFVLALATLYGAAMLILRGYRITRASHAETLRRLGAARPEDEPREPERDASAPAGDPARTAPMQATDYVSVAMEPLDVRK
jgi:Na+/melibiose symporter-like transporter